MKRVRDLKQMEVLTQNGPACGTTSLAMIIRFLTHDSNISLEDIDKEIRRLPRMFSAPVDLVKYARKKGLMAQDCNHGTLEQVERLLALGIPVMPLLDLTPENALDFDHWHWVVVVSIEKIQDDRKVLIINNPWGRQEVWEQEKFLNEWATLKLLGLTFGYDNYFIAVGDPGDKLPPCCADGTDPANNVTKGLADILNGFAAVRWDRNLGGLGHMLVGVFRMIYGLMCIIGSNIGSKIKLGTPSNDI